VEDYPRNLKEFDVRFQSEEACREYLLQLRWRDGFRCPRCGCRESSPVRTVLLRCRDCRHQTSVTAGTIFQDTRTSLRLWFQAMWWVTSQKSGVSALGLQRVLGLKSYETAWAWLHKLRRAMVRPGRDRLTGRVEVDECYLGGVTRPAQLEESTDCCCCPRGWAWDRSDSYAPDSRRFGGKPSAFCAGLSRTG
jgi:hypothetical protein